MVKFWIFWINWFTTGCGVPPLLLARWVGWVAPVCPTCGVWFVATCPLAALGVHVCAVSMAPWRSFTGARAQCGVCLVRRVCGVHGPLALVHRCACCVCFVCGVGGSVGATLSFLCFALPPLFFSFFF